MSVKTCPYCGHAEKPHWHKPERAITGSGPATLPLPMCPSCPHGMCEPSEEYLATLDPKLRAEMRAHIQARRKRHGGT